MNHLKFEVKDNSIKDTDIGFITRYGIWNHDMKAFQYVFEWDGTTTSSKSQAEKKCNELNEQHLNSL